MKTESPISETDAWEIVLASAILADARARVDEAERVKVTLTGVDDGVYRFWLWEDRDTHGATLEYLDVMPDGRLYRSNLQGDREQTQ